jgi:hypothetical protein
MAWGLWALFVLVITVLVARAAPAADGHAQLRRGNAELLGPSGPLRPERSWLPAPAAVAILYTPFARAPVPWGDVAWRWLNLGLFAGAIFRLARLARDSREPSAFLLLTLLSIPPRSAAGAMAR